MVQRLFVLANDLLTRLKPRLSWLRVSLLHGIRLIFWNHSSDSNRVPFREIFRKSSGHAGRRQDLSARAHLVDRLFQERPRVSREQSNCGRKGCSANAAEAARDSDCGFGDSPGTRQQTGHTRAAYRPRHSDALCGLLGGLKAIAKVAVVDSRNPVVMVTQW